MFYLEFVCLSHCLLFSLSDSSSGLHENFTKDVSVDNEEFWKSSAPGSGSENFLEYSSVLQDGHFSSVWPISRGKLTKT